MTVLAGVRHGNTCYTYGCRCAVGREARRATRRRHAELVGFQKRFDLDRWRDHVEREAKRNQVTPSAWLEARGVVRETINHLCRGQRTTRAPLLVAIAWALEIEPEALLDLYDGRVEGWPEGPRSSAPDLSIEGSDWVLELRRGRDPFCAR